MLPAEPDPSLADELTSLRRAVLRLEQRVHHLEELVQTPLSDAPVPHLEPAGRQPAPQPAALPGTQQPDTLPRVSRPSLESRIGSQWLNRLGIVAVLMGVAWFLKYAVDQHWLGAKGRVLAGLIAGLGLIAWSERFRSRGFPVFSFSLKAVGTGVLYLSLWAASVLFHLIPYHAALAAMALVTAGNVWLCLVQRSEVLAAFALTGGFLTPALLGFEQSSVTTLGAYLLLLDGSLFSLLALRRWPRLLPAAFAGTIVYLLWLGWNAVWVHSAGTAGAFPLAWFFFLMFSVAAVFLVPADTRGLRAGALTSAANAILGGLAIWLLWHSQVASPVHSSGSAAGLRPWIGCVEAAWLALLLAAGPLRRQQYSVLAQVHAALVLLLAAAGMWMALPAAGTILGWLLEAAVVLWLSRRRANGPAGQLLAAPLPAAALLLAAGSLLVIEAGTGGLPAATHILWNVRFALFIVAIAVASLMVRTAAAHHAQAHAYAHAEHRGWRIAGAGAAILATVLLLLAGVFEIHTYWHGHASVAERFAGSAWAALLGAAVLAVGFRIRWAFLRWQGLVLIALSIAKVSLVDTRSLTAGYRIASFLGLGILLLIVSFIYQRDLLKLRGKEHGGD